MRLSILFFVSLLTICACSISGTEEITLSYSVSFDGNGGIGTLDTSGYYIVKKGDKLLIPSNGTLSKRDYLFKYWSLMANGNGTIYFPSDSITVNENLILYAFWARSITITFELNGGVGSVPSSISIEKGGSLSLEINNITKEGFTFSGWSINNNPLTLIDLSTATFSDNTTLYAHWS